MKSEFIAFDLVVHAQQIFPVNFGFFAIFFILSVSHDSGSICFARSLLLPLPLPEYTVEFDLFKIRHA